MGAFINNTITAAGVFAAAKALSGQTITFTKIALGSGRLSEGQDISKVEAVLEPKATVDVVRKSVQSANTAVVGGVFTNGDTEDPGFWFRELGLYAEDPDLGEILYCYGNAGDFAEYIPAAGGQTVIEKNIDILTYVGNAANVRIYIAPDAYPTKADFDELTAVVNAAKSQTNDAYQIAMEARTIAQSALDQVLAYLNQFNQLNSRFETVWAALFSNVTSNPWSLTFDDLDDIVMTSGTWNVSRARLQC